jgi:hypothetical protein
MSWEARSKLTLKRIHGSGSKSSLFSIVGYQLCHPTVLFKIILAGFPSPNAKSIMKETYAIVSGTVLPPTEDKI